MICSNKTNIQSFLFVQTACAVFAQKLMYCLQLVIPKYVNIMIKYLYPLALSPFRVRAFQPTAGLTFTCPQKEGKDMIIKLI